MRHCWILFYWIAFLCPESARAEQEPHIRAWLTPDHLIVGQTCTLHLEVSGPEAADCDIARIPEMPGIEVKKIAGPRFLQRPVSEDQTETDPDLELVAAFQIVLLPLRAGTHDIPPVEIRMQQGMRFLSPALTLAVGTASRDDHGIVLQVTNPDDQVYLYERAVFCIELVMRKERLYEIERLGQDELLFLPWLENEPSFIQPEISDPGTDVARREIPVLGGETRLLFEVRMGSAPAQDRAVLSAQVSYLPTKSGFFDFPPTIYTVQMPEGETIVCESEPGRLEVKPLPEQGRPESFINGVGSFHAECSLDRHRVRMGDTVEWTFTLTGEGNLDLLTMPDFNEFEESFRVYGSSEGRDGDRRWKIFQLSPTRMPMTRIPALEFSFFDPKTESYEIRRFPEEEIQVYPGDERAIGMPPDPTDQDSSRKDIVTIIQDWPGPGWLESAFWPSIIVFCLSFIAFLATWGRACARARQKEAELSERRMAALSALRHAVNGAESAEELARSFGDFYAQSFGLARPEVLAGSLSAALIKQGVGAETAKKAEAIVRRIDSVRFSATGEAGIAKELSQDALDLVGRLEGEVRP